MSWHPSKLFRVVLLPLLLSAATVLGLGSYCETSDDTSLAWLFSGVLALKPVPSVPLFLHGYGHALAAAYLAAPGVPWLGLLLGGLLGAATVLTLAVLDKLLRPHLRPWPLVLALVGFFGVAWLEHWLWFSHARVALLLAGAAVLFAAQRPGRWGALAIGLAGVGAAWLLRPGLGVLGVGAVLPAAVLLAGSLRRAAPVVASVAFGLVLATGAAALLQTPAEARTQARDRAFAHVLDFDQLTPQPRTPADSLGTAALGLWLMGDSTVVSEALCQRAYRFDAHDFWLRKVPAKLRLRAGLLVRDYFPILLGLVIIAVGRVRRRGRQLLFWLVQGGFVTTLIVFAGVLKLPPRLALPLLDFWLLTSLVFLLRKPSASLLSFAPDAAAEAGFNPIARPVFPLLFRRVATAAALATVVIYGAKIGHRHQVLGQEQHRHELALQAISHAGVGRMCILAGANDLLKSLSPFRTYAPGSGPWLVLTGWPAHDASQSHLRLALSGTTDQTECLRRLAMRPNTGPQAPPLWVLTPETAAWLSRRFRSGGARLLLSPAPGQPAFLADTALRIYQVRPWPAPGGKGHF